jgi:hypothetical protein
MDGPSLGIDLMNFIGRLQRTQSFAGECLTSWVRIPANTWENALLPDCRISAPLCAHTMHRGCGSACDRDHQ